MVLRMVNIIIVNGILITDSSIVHSHCCSEVFMHHSYHYGNTFMIVFICCARFSIETEVHFSAFFFAFFISLKKGTIYVCKLTE